MLGCKIKHKSFYNITIVNSTYFKDPTIQCKNSIGGSFDKIQHVMILDLDLV